MADMHTERRFVDPPDPNKADVPDAWPQPVTEVGKAVASKGTAYVRTVLPAAWAGLVLWLATRLELSPGVQAWLGPLGLILGVPLATGLVYIAARWIESHRWPTLIIRLLLGSTQQPVYVAPAVAEQAADPSAPAPLVTVQAPATSDEPPSNLDILDGVGEPDAKE